MIMMKKSFFAEYYCHHSPKSLNHRFQNILLAERYPKKSFSNLIFLQVNCDNDIYININLSLINILTIYGLECMYVLICYINYFVNALLRNYPKNEAKKLEILERDH